MLGAYPLFLEELQGCGLHHSDAIDQISPVIGRQFKFVHSAIHREVIQPSRPSKAGAPLGGEENEKLIGGPVLRPDNRVVFLAKILGFKASGTDVRNAVLRGVGRPSGLFQFPERPSAITSRYRLLIACGAPGYSSHTSCTDWRENSMSRFQPSMICMR